MISQEKIIDTKFQFVDEHISAITELLFGENVAGPRSAVFVIKKKDPEEDFDYDCYVYNSMPSILRLVETLCSEVLKAGNGKAS